jgi:hypothetical protein
MTQLPALLVLRIVPTDEGALVLLPCGWTLDVGAPAALRACLVDARRLVDSARVARR